MSNSGPSAAAQQSVSVEVASRKAFDKRTFAIAMARNGYLIPKSTQSLHTYKYMVGVREGRFFCPHKADVKTAAICADMPTSKHLKELVINALELRSIITKQEKFQATADLLRKKNADAQWLLTVLKVVEPDHEVFSRQYIKPERKKVKEPMLQRITIPNNDGFFSDLPDVLPIGSKKRMRLSKEQRLLLSITSIETQMKDMKERLVAKQNEVVALQAKSNASKVEVDADVLRYLRERANRLDEIENQQQQQQQEEVKVDEQVKISYHQPDTEMAEVNQQKTPTKPRGRGQGRSIAEATESMNLSDKKRSHPVRNKTTAPIPKGFY